MTLRELLDEIGVDDDSKEIEYAVIIEDPDDSDAHLVPISIRWEHADQQVVITI